MKENATNKPISNAEKFLVDVIKKNNSKIFRKIEKVKKKQAKKYAK